MAEKIYTVYEGKVASVPINKRTEKQVHINREDWCLAFGCRRVLPIEFVSFTPEDAILKDLNETQRRIQYTTKILQEEMTRLTALEALADEYGVEVPRAEQ